MELKRFHRTTSTKYIISCLSEMIALPSKCGVQSEYTDSANTEVEDLSLGCMNEPYMYGRYGHDTNQFRWKYPHKREGFKPEVVFSSKMLFNDTTSHKTQFPEYGVEPRKDYTPQVNVPPDEPF